MARTGASSTEATASSTSASNSSSNNNTNTFAAALEGIVYLVVVVFLFYYYYYFSQHVAPAVAFTVGCVCGLTVGARIAWRGVVDGMMQGTKKNVTAVTKLTAGMETAVDTDTHNLQNIVAAAPGLVGAQLSVAAVPIIYNHRSNHTNHNTSETAARALLTKKGFDPDDLNKVDNTYGYTPMIYYSRTGNVTMVRYLIARGADCQQHDMLGWFPLYWAASRGQLEIIKLLSQDGGAHEDIRRVTECGYSPLRNAFIIWHVPVIQWLICNGALASRDGDGGVDDAIMRRDLRQGNDWRDDKRETVLSWARGAVTTYDNFQLFLTSTSLTFNGKQLPGELELIAQYVGGTPQQLHTLRQLIHHLSAFITEVPFMEED